MATQGNFRCLPKFHMEHSGKCFQLISIKWCIGACICVTVATLSIIWTPFDLILDERLRMRPGLPFFGWWRNPPDIVRIKISLFNITNAERFLNGDDPKLKMEETEPVFLKLVTNISNVVFNNNSTLSYDVSYHCVYDPSMNNVDINATVVTPNIAALLLMSRLWDSNFFVKMLFNQLLERLSTEVITEKTMYEVLFNNTDPLLSLGGIIAPFMMPWKNLALVPLVIYVDNSLYVNHVFASKIYNGIPHRVTLFIGTKHGHHKYLLINKYDGNILIPKREETCKDNIVDSYTESGFNQLMTKMDVVKVFNPFICKNDVYSFEDETYYHGIKSYRFLLKNNSYDRTEPIEEDCYKSEPILPNGTSDMAPCYSSNPITISFPHFLFGSEALKKSVDGMRPNESEHRSYLIAEPVTGTVLNVMNAIQTNVHVRSLKGFPKQFERFSDKIIPVTYTKLFFHEPGYYLLYTLRFVLVLPIIGSVLTAFLFTCGLFCLWKSKRKSTAERKKASAPRPHEDREGETAEEMVFLENTQD